jgi:hypothetical protein
MHTDDRIRFVLTNALRSMDQACASRLSSPATCRLTGYLSWFTRRYFGSHSQASFNTGSADAV